ncbi:MAG: U32 family peptidase, partial [Lentisphaeria bacterium]|nr:U32 family peptidase [Lentisphaeria bacterium]
MSKFRHRHSAPRQRKRPAAPPPSDLPPKPELLAPAGTLDAGIAAIDHGADAVYFGLSRFNARERGRNLTLEQGGQLVEHAHANGAKAYVTLNTLIKESELADMACLLGELLLFAPDAVIVQDLGVLRMLRRHFPELPVHASTQMGIHNSAGVEVVAGLGVQRVILQRQVTFDEIRAVQSKVQTELEVFVHGALCCSRSGACLLSSWLGGWSGNRGKCKQPCRRRFHSSEGNGFFLSTNDLCLLDSVPELRRMGVASLKIEGRLRGVDYVTSAVRAYRMMLDAEPGMEKTRIKEARRALSESLGRKWSRGFRTEGDFDHVVQHTSLGGSGLLLGRVGKQTSDGFDIVLSRPLARGDRIRVQPESGDEGPSLEVQHLLSQGRPAKRVPGGKTATIGTDLDIPANGYVFKTANRQPDMSVRLAKLPPPTPALPLAIRVHADCLEVSVSGLGIPPWRE